MKNELIIANKQLPAKVEDLSNFVLFARAKLETIRSGLKAIDKLDLAKEVREQKKREAQDLADLLIDAEARIGELLEAIPKEKPGRKKEELSDSAVTYIEEKPKTVHHSQNESQKRSKTEVVQNLGFTKKDTSRFQQLAKNKEVIETAKKKARENDEVVSRTQVLKEIQNKKKEEKKIERIESIKKTATLPDTKYRIVYADPPWCYNDKHEFHGTTGAETHYNSMTIEQLCNMPIKDKIEKDAVLFIWVTSPLLEECFKVINAWGFKYKTSFVWDKIKHNMGHYNSVRHEFLLISTRGSCTPDEKKLFDSVQSIERTNKHSEKPNEFRNIIDVLYKYGKKIEIFARKKYNENWDYWGNEL